MSQELPATINLTVGYTGSKGRDMFLRGVANTFDHTTRLRPVPERRPGRLQDRPAASTASSINGNPITGCGEASYDALQIGATRRFRAGLTGGLQYQYSRNRGTTQGSNEAATVAEHVRLRHRVRHQHAGHPAHVQRLAGLPAARSAARWPAAGASAASSTRAAACRLT